MGSGQHAATEAMTALAAELAWLVAGVAAWQLRHAEQHQQVALADFDLSGVGICELAAVQQGGLWQ